MCEQEKKQQRIYDVPNAETKTKKAEIIGVSLWPLSSPDPKPLDYAIWVKKKQKKNEYNFSFRLKLLLRSYGIKCLKNLFWRHVNCFEGVMIQWLKNSGHIE